MLQPVMETLCSQIKKARQQRHLSQSDLARKVGCKQSALSMYENGQTRALGSAIIGKICDELGLIPPTQAELLEDAQTKAKGVRTFCPNPDCLSNLPLQMGGQTLLVPQKHVAEGKACHCAWCGEVLEKACPECGEPVNAGAFCECCGTAYLVETPERADPARIAASERLMAWSL